MFSLEPIHNEWYCEQCYFQKKAFLAAPTDAGAHARYEKYLEEIAAMDKSAFDWTEDKQTCFECGQFLKKAAMFKVAM